MSEDLRGQAAVIDFVRRRVDEWRGFALGGARDAVPDAPPRYEPLHGGDSPLSPVSMALLQHWFRREPHCTGAARTPFKYWPHQRRLVETFVYLYEVRGIRLTEDLYSFAGVEPLGRQRDPWAKLGGQLATGSGKTKMMSLVIAWSYLNAVWQGDGNRLGFGRHALVIAPGLFVRDRLLQDFSPRTGTSVFFADPVVPPEYDSVWDLKVYDPQTCPRRLDPREGALVVTNFHQLLRERDEAAEAAMRNPADAQRSLFELGDPERLEAVDTPLLDRFSDSQGLLVLNDEAHHVWDETGHAQFEQAARARAGEDEAVARGWIRSIRRLNGSADHAGRVALQVDLSATLFEETGAVRRPGKRAGREKVEFREANLFRHTAVHYGLAEAIVDGIVKKPILEKVEVRNRRTGEPEELVRAGQPNAWETYRNLLVTGIERWKKVRDQLRAEGDPRKPILFLLCNDRNEAREVANYLLHGRAVREDLSNEPPAGYTDPTDGEVLFVEGAGGAARPTVVEIHVGQKEQTDEEDWEKIRQAVNAVDHDFVHALDADGRPVSDADGRPVMEPNPYNVVVSVMMLKEGWDVRNVKVIVPLRPCDSRTLTEQTLGRGLRRMHAPVVHEDGSATLDPVEELYVIEHPSFERILDQIKDLVEEKKSDEIDHSREYVAIEPLPEEKDRVARDVRLVRFEGLAGTPDDWRRSFDLRLVPDLAPRLPWAEQIDETEIHTWLVKALSGVQTDGQTFVLPAEPSYRDFDHVLEAAYALPLLQELRAGYHHKTAVKGLVQRFLEEKTFALPAGVPLSFDRAMDGPGARIAIGNLARPDVMGRVRDALRKPLHDALTAPRRAAEPLLAVRRASEVPAYQALKRFVLEAPARSGFKRQAMENDDELRVAALLDCAPDVNGWIYNHRSGVNFSIEYDWQGFASFYHPDFIARARFGEVVHNFIVEVKGRLDDRDKAKARRGVRYCEQLTDFDGEPWHYLMLVENVPLGRQDISWWQGRAPTGLEYVLRRHESLELYPEQPLTAGLPFALTDAPPGGARPPDVVPVYDLKASAGAFGPYQAPAPVGWARVRTRRPLDPSVFAAQVVGKSMEPSVPDRSWVLLRGFPVGSEPSALALDGRRVVVELASGFDAELGGSYTLKRWKVAGRDPQGHVVSVELRPDNRTFQPIPLRPGTDRPPRVVAELLDVLA